MTEPKDDEINMRSTRYSLIIARGECPHCGGGTRWVALLLPPGHETWDDSWQRVPVQALLFHVYRLPERVLARLEATVPGFRFAASPVTKGSCFANHCVRCGALQEDYELFCEPGGAFQPVTAAAAAKLELVRIEEPFEAAAAGYAIDPEFLGCSEAKVTWRSSP